MKQIVIVVTVIYIIVSGGRGMGELMPGSYPVPQNPVNSGRIGAYGLARAYSPAY